MFYPKLIVKAKAMEDKLCELFDFLGEILGKSKFDDEKRIKEIIQEAKSRIEMGMLQRGHVIAANHLCSYFSPIEQYEENLKGLDFYKFLADLDKNFDSKIATIKEKLRELTALVF